MHRYDTFNVEVLVLISLIAGRCAKECPGTNVDNLLSAQQLRGCTKIVGSLEIQIRGEST